MIIEIIKWESFNPRKDYKSIPWIRLDVQFPYDSKFFEFDAEQKYFWIFLLCTAGQNNKAEINLNLKHASHFTGISEKKVKETVQAFETIGAVRVTNADVRETFATNETNERTIRTVVEKKKIEIPYNSIIDYLNQKCGTNYKASTQKTKDFIKSRFEGDNYSLPEFKKVIDTKSQEWLNTGQAKYLRPQTLFGTNFESYLNQLSGAEGSSKKESVDICGGLADFKAKLLTQGGKNGDDKESYNF